MTPLPTILDTSRVTFNWRNSETATTAHNVMHFANPDGNEGDLAASIVSNLNINQFSAMTNNTFLDSLDIINLDGTSATTHFPQPGTFVGGGGTSPMPAVAAIVSLATGERGPQGRGRIYIPFMGEEQCEAGQLSNASFDAMNAEWEAFRDDMVADDKPIVVASYAHTIRREAVSVVVRRILGTQRRRQDALR